MKIHLVLLLIIDTRNLHLIMDLVFLEELSLLLQVEVSVLHSLLQRLYFEHDRNQRPLLPMVLHFAGHWLILVAFALHHLH